jgi:hypothetical protein
MDKHLVSEFELAAPLCAVRLQEGRRDRSLTSAFTQRNTAIVNQCPSYRFTAIYRPLRRRYFAKKHLHPSVSGRHTIMGHMMLTLTVVRAEPVELERELLDLEQLRWRVVESLSSRLQGPRQRHILRVKLSELNRSIASIRRTLSEAA